MRLGTSEKRLRILSKLVLERGREEGKGEREGGERERLKLRLTDLETPGKYCSANSIT